MSSKRDRVDALLDEAEQEPFSGWDFSWLRGRLDSDPLPWDYTAAVDDLASRSPDLLDLGTGGGEWLAALPNRPRRTLATESWPPNVRLARSRLAPLGVQVVQVPPARDNTGAPTKDAPTPLPFGDRSFHLIACRHESFEVAEVARVLEGGGWFITQQVDAGSDDDYRRLLGLDPIPLDPGDRFEAWLLDELSEAGFHVVEHRSAPLVQIVRDVGALAWNLKAIPWMIPGFTIARYRERLREIQACIDRDGPLVVNQRRFWAKARKANPDA